jgi:hypothetical protein
MLHPVAVKIITETCSACPYQLEGFTEDDQEIYVRYRWGTLTIYVGGEAIFEWKSDNPWGGEMTYDELKALTRDRIIWPELS